MNDFPVPSKLWDLPSCPWVVRQLLQRFPLTEEQVPEVLEIIGWDSAMSARILAAANGTRSAESAMIPSLEEASRLLGADAVLILSLQFSLDSLSRERARDRRLYDSHFRHVRFARAAVSCLCGAGPERFAVDPRLLAVLSRLGRLVLIQHEPRTAGEVFAQMLDSGKPWDEVAKTLEPADSKSLFKRLPEDVFPSPIFDLISQKAERPPASESRLRAILDVAETTADFLEYAEEEASASTEWRFRLEAAYERFLKEEPEPVPLEEFLESVRRLAAEAFPADSEALAEPVAHNEVASSSSEMLRLAHRELGRLAWAQSHRDREEQRRALETIRKQELTISRLEHQALRDPLTEVYNRRFFLESFRKEAARCCRRGAPIGLLFLDVDAFKALNDTWGHLVGDLVLKQVASALVGVLRGADVIARYGGEEFVVLPNDPNERGMLLLAERLRFAVEQLTIPVDEGEISVTISIGCTLTVPKQNEDELPRQLLASADAAMYDAKQLGRNQVVFRSLLDDAERALMQQTIDCSFSRWLIQRNILSEEALESVMMDYVPERAALGELAVELGFLTSEQVAKVLAEQAAGGERFGTLALQQKLVTPEQLALLLARQRENPLTLAELLIENNLLTEPTARKFVDEYLASASG